MKIGLLLILLFLFSLAAAQSTSIPMTLKDNLIYIPVRINESRVLNFLFDTGAEVTVVDRKIAEEINLEITGKSRIGTASKTVDAATSTGNILQLEKLMIDSQSIEILSIQHLSEYLGTQLDGIIGFELLNKFVVTTDLDQLKFILRDTTGFHPSGHSMVVEKIDLEHHHFGLPLEVKFEKHSEPVTLVFKFDTAYPDYLSFHNAAVEEFKLLDKGNFKERKGFGADTTITTNLRTKIREVSLENNAWKNIPVIYEVDHLSVAPTENATEAGLVGQEILNQFNITYNYLKGLVYFEKRN